MVSSRLTSPSKLSRTYDEWSLSRGWAATTGRQAITVPGWIARARTLRVIDCGDGSSLQGYGHVGSHPACVHGLVRNMVTWVHIRPVSTGWLGIWSRGFESGPCHVCEFLVGIL